jgi:Tfp pilus assembly protein PilO
MIKLPKEKRNELVVVVIVTIVVLAGLFFGLIHFQKQNLTNLADRKIKAQAKLDKVEQTVKNAERVEAQMAETTRKLAELEDDMAPGDALSWMVSKIKLFKLPYKVETPQISQAVIRDVDLLPKFPYKQATFGVGGTAYYHELGKFLADFENHFPHFRLANLDVQPALADTEREKLTFKVDIVTLVKPGAF